MKNKIDIKLEYLPIKLISKVNELIFNNSNFEYRTKNNFLKCIGIIFNKQLHEYYSMEVYVATGASYWKKVFGGDYHWKVIEPLIEFNIIQCHDFGFRSFSNKELSANKGKLTGSVGIRYRINPELTDDDNFAIIYYINKGRSTLTAKEVITNKGLEFTFESISDKNFYVSIDQQKASEWVKYNAENICHEFLKTNYINELPDDLNIKYNLYLEGGSYNTRYGTVKSTKLMAEAYNKQLFFFKDDFYLADFEVFMKYRINALKYHYNREISAIGNLPIKDIRNTKTLRLYNHLVNFPSKILQFININNLTVIQIDLRTSQFLLFANLLNIYISKGEDELLNLFIKKQTRTYLKRLFTVLKEHQDLLPKTGIDINNPNTYKKSGSDVFRFITDVFSYDFYTIIQKKLNLPDRSLAKLVLFKLLFKKGSKPDILLKMLSQQYPVVISIITEFKKLDKEQNSTEKFNSDDSNNFSVFLQCVEAEIYVDNILKPLREQGIPCFSRHDSIVVACGYEDEAEKFIINVFNRFGFKYNQKVEDKFWDVVDWEELENSVYFDSIPEDYNLIFEDEDNNSTNHTLDDEDDDDQLYLDEWEKEIIEQLCEIGIKEDYSELLNNDSLGDIIQLTFLTDGQKYLLEYEIEKRKSLINSFSSETNELLRSIILKKDLLSN